MSEEKTPEYEVRLWCENGDLAAFAEVHATGATVAYEVDTFAGSFEGYDNAVTLDQAERDARRWIMSQDEYDTEGYSVQVIRNGQDVTSDPSESF